MKNRNPLNRGLAGHSTIWSLCTITFCAFTAGQSLAQSTWSGAAGVNWNDAGNWDAIPADDGALTFGGGTPDNQPSNNDLIGLITGAINFTHAGPGGISPNNSTAAFTLGGNAITLGGNITTSAATQTTGVPIDITDTIAMDVILTGTRTITLGFTGGTSINRVSHPLTISGLVSDAGGGFGFIKTGNPTLTLSNGGNTFSGALSINQGLVEASVLAGSGTASSIGSGSVVNFGNGGATGTLRFTGSSATIFSRDINLASTGIGGGSIDNSATDPLVTLTVNGTFTNSANNLNARVFGIGGTNTGANSLDSTLVNSVGSGPLSFSKSGTGTWTVTGDNTFTGNVDIQNGILNVAAIADTGTSNLGIGSGTIQMGVGGQTGTLLYTGTGSTTARQIIIGGGSNTAVGGAIIQASAADGTSTGLKFTAENFNTTGGTATVNRNLTLGGSNTDANEISGIIANHGTATGTTSVIKNGDGLWILAGNGSTYTGITTVTGGTLQVNSATNGLGDSVASNAVNLNGGTLSLRNNGAGNNGSIIYGSTANPSGYNVQLTTNITINVANLTANTGNTIALGPLTQATQLQRVLNVTGANGYLLSLASLGLSPGNLGRNTTLTPTTASLTINGDVTNPMSGFAETPTANNTLTLSGTSTGNRIQGAISDAVGANATDGGLTQINKVSTSTWALNGNNTNDGVVTINAGTLLINGNSSGATGAITVNGGTLGGAGTIGGAVTLAAGGSLAPGNAGVGTLALGSDLTVTEQATGAGKLVFQLNTIAASDKITVAGTLNIGTDVFGFSDFTFSTLPGLTNGTYPLITGATGLGVGDTLDATNLTGTLGAGPAQGELQLVGNDIVLVVTDAVASDPFLTWTGNNPSVLFDGDENNDGVENGLAWFLGAGTPADNANGLLPESSQTAGALVLEFDCLDATARGAAVFQVQYSDDLAAWAGTDVPGTVGTFTAGVVDFVVTDPAPEGGLLNVVATIPVTEAGAGKLFGRLNGVK